MTIEQLFVITDNSRFFGLLVSTLGLAMSLTFFVEAIRISRENAKIQKSLQRMIDTLAEPKASSELNPP